MKKAGAALLVLFALALPSCSIATLQRQGTVEVSFTAASGDPAPAGLVAAARDSILPGGQGRFFDAAHTASFRLEVSAPDIEKTIVSTSTYSPGVATTVRLSVPVGKHRLLVLTALDSASNALTQGRSYIDVNAGENSVDLPMAPVAADLVGNLIALGPTGASISPSSAGTYYYYVDIPDDMTCSFFCTANAGSAPDARIYASDGSRILPSSSADFPGRFTAQAGRYYLAVPITQEWLSSFSAAGPNYTIGVDVDWRPEVLGLVDGIQDSREPIRLSFPNPLSWASITSASVTDFNTGSLSDLPTPSASGNELSYAPPLQVTEHEWTPDSAISMTAHTDPQVQLNLTDTRHVFSYALTASLADIRRFAYAAPWGSDSASGRAGTPTRSIDAALSILSPPSGSPAPGSRLIAATGTYDSPTSMSVTTSMKFLGGWQASAGLGTWTPNPSGISVIRFGNPADPSSPASLSVSAYMSDFYAEGFSFKCLRLGNLSNPDLSSLYSVSVNANYGTASFSRCRFYAPAFAGTENAPLESTGAQVYSFGGTASFDRCSFNWPQDDDAACAGGRLSIPAASADGLVLSGLSLSGGALNLTNSIVSGGSLSYPSGATFAQDRTPRISALTAGSGATDIKACGNTFLSGTAPDELPWTPALRHIVHQESPGISLLFANNLFANQTRADDSSIGLFDAAGDFVSDYGSVNVNAFSGLTDGDLHFAYGSTGDSGISFSLPAVFHPENALLDSSLRVLGDAALRHLPGADLGQADILPIDLLDRDYYGEKRSPAWSVGAAEYR